MRGQQNWQRKRFKKGRVSITRVLNLFGGKKGTTPKNRSPERESSETKREAGGKSGDVEKRESTAGLRGRGGREESKLHTDKHRGRCESKD